MRSLAEDWLKQAGADLAAAENCLGDASSPQKVTWYSRQCIDKSLRAVAESRNIELPSGYDLNQLTKLAKKYNAQIELPDTEEAEVWLEAARKTINQCMAIVRQGNHDDDSIWDSHSLLYF